MENKNVNFRELTAPCGLDCFNCLAYLANDNEEIRKKLASYVGLTYEEAVCKGCRKDNGCRFLHMAEPCRVFKCVNSKHIETCADCPEFPCDNLHPYADRAMELPHNLKVFNLALIRKMGMDKWAQEKAKHVRGKYFNEKFNI
ncbi:MAG: DUF3795 domain-containing protein [Candidatus Methanofastidiosa archaeon]|nr:DUF3795 domain-containing protein [Candidatus Methanofastidiosa archaeon]